MIFNDIIFSNDSTTPGIKRITKIFNIHPIAALLGPRQCGKTTLARVIAEHEQCTYFDLENPVDIRRLSAPHEGIGRTFRSGRH